MSKIKPLSRNKKIKILHESTGKTYKECRAILKAYNWSLEDALGINNLIAALQVVPEAIQRFYRVLSAFSEAVSAALNTFTDTLTEALSDD